MPLVNTVDAAITFRIIKGLVTPWTSTDAYRYGIIDRNGNPLKKVEDLKSSKEQAAYTMLDRLIFKLKRILQKIPMVNRNLVNFAAALWLIKECLIQNQEPKNISQLYEKINGSHTIIEKELQEIREYNATHPNLLLLKAILNEDGASAGGAPVGGQGPSIGNIANNAGGGKIAGFAGDAGRKPLLKKKPLRRGRPGEPSNITSPTA